ncbi:MAG: T9SS type A sorting domain-containing protein [Bacteroidota bacterium]
MTRFALRFLFGLSCLFLPAGAWAGTNGVISIASWNLLNWPSAGSGSAATDSATRCPYYRTVISSLKPSILVTEENQSTSSVPWFLSAVMNANGAYYRQGVYIQGPDSNNGIFYLDSLFKFVSNRPIETTLRDISEFTMIYKPTGDTFRIYAVHLKASTGSANEAQRAQEVDSLRKVTNALPAGSDFIVCGDFNVYGDYEACYQGLIRNDSWNDGEFVDPFQLSGIWNNAAYRFYHTQSTRTTQFGGGSYGGLDDRFDMILCSNGVMQSGGMYYVPGSCHAFGNDGSHYQLAINSGTNNAVGSAVADALHFSSDHLPVVAEFEFGTNSSVGELAGVTGLVVYPNPAKKHIVISFAAPEPGVFQIQLLDSRGGLVYDFPAVRYGSGDFSRMLMLPEELKAGNYVLSMQSGKSLISRQLIISN